jgi:uncharacterized membrane protein (UPF0127 family)
MTDKNPKLVVPRGNKIATVIVALAGLWVVYILITALLSNNVRLIGPAGFITVEVADTDKLRVRGLSGHEPLTEKEGMLFVFDQASTDNCFWMKDMSFAIDMVWLDAEKQVVTVAPDVKPESYPDTFCPDLPAKYGLELASDRAKTLEIVPDSKLRW